jgi:hypothetical protein
MIGGVFDRYPELHVSLTEVRADWLPATMHLLDRCAADGDAYMRRRPSEYWQTHCWVGASSIKQSEVRLRHQIGIDRMMFGRDYPHAEGTWPNTWDWLSDALADLTSLEVRAVLGDNAMQCYRLDESALRSISATIGPFPEDISGRAVSPQVIDSFADRGGYRRSYEHIDEVEVERRFRRDLERLAG